MANLQYIGARYVPKFYENSLDPSSMDWESGHGYEPLTVVTYNSDTYTSRIPVPSTVGNPATNPTYWAKTADFNAALVALQNSVNNIENTELPAIRNDTADNASDIANVIERTPVDGDYIVFIGDSFVGGASLGANINQRFSTRVASMLNLIEKNYAVGGTGYVTSSPTYEVQVSNAVTDFNNNNFDKSKVKYFVIGGGANDGAIAPSNMGTFMTAVKNTINAVAADFPNASIVVIPYIWKAVFMPQNYLESINYICQAAIETDKKVVIIDDAYKWMVGRFDHILYQSGAMVHPDVYGHAIMARNCYSGMLGHNYKTPSYFSLNYLSPTYHTDISSGVGEFDCDGDYVHFRMVVNVGADISGVQTIMTFSRINFASMRSFYTGDQTIFVSPIARNTSAQITNPPKWYIQTTVNMTDDGQGTYDFTVGQYDGVLYANNKYYIDVRVPFGVIDTSVNP